MKGQLSVGTRNPPILIAVTGAAGHIGYNLLFRIAGGAMFGQDQPVILKLLDIPAMMRSLESIALELMDCAFPLLVGVEVTADPGVAFTDVDVALLIGARPRTKGFERRDLLAANAAIFAVHGRALNAMAARHVKVLVVGNPANTNAWIARQCAPDLKPENFTALMRLDHNRTVAQLAKKLNCSPRAVRNVIVWGNHSATQYPDIFHARLDDERIWPKIDDDVWLTESLIPTVQNRGSQIIEMRGSSTVGSAVAAIIDHMRDWHFGTPPGEWVSMGVSGDGAYGIPREIICGQPVICEAGSYRIVQGLCISEFSRAYLQRSCRELLDEQLAVRHILYI